MRATPEESIFTPLDGQAFYFRCHRDIPCFTECCAKLRLILTPYDILRMKNRLKLPSDTFLERYTETILDKRSRFPWIKLRMGSDSKQRCPFVTAEGCSIYQDRPEACRLYPVGRASALVGGGEGTVERFFMVTEAHCLGFKEKQAWTLEQWVEHEGIRQYRAMNREWLRILSSPRSLGQKAHLARKHQMFFMASYNLDRFRDFLFNSGFFHRFRIDRALKEKLRADDTELMLFGFDWLKFSLFGEKTIEVIS